MSLLTVLGLMVVSIFLGRWSVSKQPANEEEAVPEAYIFRVEEHGGVVFGYDRKTNRFLGQHEDVIELTQLVTKKVPGHKFYIAVSGGDNESV